MKESITCPKCRLTSHHPMDARFGWCGNCNAFLYEMIRQGIDLNGVIADLQRNLRSQLATGDPFSLQFEQFAGGDGALKWRALVKLGSVVRHHSRREHETPTDAVRELSEIASAKKRPPNHGTH